MRTFAALLVMFALPLFIPVMPVPGAAGLIAGGLGGYLAGTAGRAVMLALLPAFLLAAAILLLSFGVGLPWLGPIVAGLALLWVAVESAALLVGAAIGGVVAARRERELRARPRLAGPPATHGRPVETSLPPVEPRPTLDEPERPPR